MYVPTSKSTRESLEACFSIHSAITNNSGEDRSSIERLGTVFHAVTFLLAGSAGVFRGDRSPFTSRLMYGHFPPVDSYGSGYNRRDHEPCLFLLVYAFSAASGTRAGIPPAVIRTRD